MSKAKKRNIAEKLLPPYIPLWHLDIAQLEGHNIEEKGRDIVNEMLKKGWVLLHIYTLKYSVDGMWQERPMAILGKPRTKKPL